MADNYPLITITAKVTTPKEAVTVTTSLDIQEIRQIVISKMKEQYGDEAHVEIYGGEIVGKMFF